MINLKIQDIETLFNTIKDLYDYELNRADKDKLLSEITRRAENPRSFKQIGITVSQKLQKLILTNNYYATLVKTWEMTVTINHPSRSIPRIPIIITFNFYKL